MKSDETGGKAVSGQSVIPAATGIGGQSLKGKLVLYRTLGKRPFINGGRIGVEPQYLCL